MEKIFRVALGRDETKDQRLKIYRDLVFSRLEDALSVSFPIFKSFVGEDFGRLVSEFMKNGPRTPILLEASREFAEFFRKKEDPLKERIPFLDELVLFEWLEIEVFNAEEEETSEFSWERTYRLSESARLVSFSYPIHRVEGRGPEEITKAKGKYNLLIYRDPLDLEVKSVDLTEFVHSLLCDVDRGLTPKEALLRRKETADPEEVGPYLDRFFRELCSKALLVSRSVHRSLP